MEAQEQEQVTEDKKPARAKKVMPKSQFMQVYAMHAIAGQVPSQITSMGSEAYEKITAMNEGEDCKNFVLQAVAVNAGMSIASGGMIKQALHAWKALHG